MSMRTVNLEQGKPTVEQARARLKDALAAAKRERIAVLKLIHGYGSSGAGGALRGAIRDSLRHRRKEGLIRAAIYGENWSIFDPRTQQVLEEHPACKRDSDLDQFNEGVTIVLL
jgi:hypothetical protein